MKVRKIVMIVAALAAFAPLFVSASVSLATPNTSILSQGLMGYWPLDGSTINWTTGTVADVSGNAVSAAITGLATSSAPTAGVLGGALRFNASGSLQTSAFSSVPQSITLSVWIKPNAAGGVVLDELGQGGTWHDSQIEVETNNVIKVCIWIGSSSCVTAASGIQYGTWYQVVLDYNVTTHTLQSYVNGVMTASATLTKTYPTSALAYGIGLADATNNGDGSAFSGVIDDVRIYGRALSAQEVSLLYALGTIHAGNTQAVNSSFSIDQTGLNGGLVAYWPLDGDTTNWATGVTKDISGNGYNGQFKGFSTSTSPVAGKIGQALSFNGSTSYVTTGYTVPAQSSATSFTWSVWVKLNPTSNGNLVIIGNRGGGGATWVKLTPTALEYSGSIISNSIPTGQWVFVTIVKNGTNFTYYQNGAVIGTATNSTSVSAYTFFMGEDPGFPGDGVLTGDLDDVRIYNRALSQQEVQQLYAAGRVNVAHSNTSSSTGINSGLVGYWTFDGPTINWRTNTVSDMSGKGDTGTLVSMSTSSSPVAGKIGQALKFSAGLAQEMSLGTAPAPLVFAYNQPFTVALWAKPAGTVSSGIFDRLFSITGSAGTFEYFIMANNNAFSFNVGKNGTGDISITSPFSVGQWYDIVGVYDGTNVTLYMNGVKVSSSAYTYGALSSSAGAVTIGGAGSTSTVFNGAIDDVRVYNRALSAQEVQQLYQAGK